MLENIKAVNNPLTIIAISLLFAEIAGTIALATVDRSLQQTFVWFCNGLPHDHRDLAFSDVELQPKGAVRAKRLSQ